MAARSGQITVVTAGTAVQGPSTTTGSTFLLAAHPANAQAVWVGSDAEGDDVANTNGYPLKPGASVTIQVSDLSALWFDADANGEKICWLKLN